MAERFIILERVGNGFFMKSTGDRGDGFVVTIPVTLDDTDYWIDTETNTGNTRVYVPDSYDGEIFNLHFSAVTPLTDLKIRSAEILTIDLTAARDLTFLNLISNELDDLDLSNLVNLEYITLFSNSLETLDISKCPNLNHVSVVYNNLTEAAVDSILHYLVAFGLEDGYVNLSGNTVPSSDGIADGDILVGRNWNVNYDMGG